MKMIYESLSAACHYIYSFVLLSSSILPPVLIRLNALVVFLFGAITTSTVVPPEPLMENRAKVFSTEETRKMDADFIALPPGDVVKEAAARVRRVEAP